VRRVLGTLGPAIAIVVMLAGPASAHAGLVSSDPANGATVASAPGAITMTFTEPPDASLSVVTVLDAGGNPIAAGTPERTGATGLRVALLSGLGDGVYTVNWRVVSAADGHLTAGVIAFGVGTSPGAVTAAPQPGAPAPSVLSVVAKILLYAGLMLLVAVAVVGLGAFRGTLEATNVVAMVAAVLSLAGAVLFVFAERSTVGVSMSDLLRSDAGRSLRWLLVGVLAADALAVLAVARRRWRPVLWAAGAAGAVAMLIRASGSHAAAAQPAWTQETLQWFHFLAAGAWIGGILLLVLLIRQHRDDPAPVGEARRFSNIATVAVGVILVTGSFRAVHELGGLKELAHLFSSAYGTVLTIKVVIVLGLISLGAVNRQRSIPRLAEDAKPLRRVASMELVAAVGVLALTATLTGLAPARSAQANTGPVTPPSVTVTGSDFATTTRVSLEVAPGTPGANDFTARVADYDTGAPAGADEVALRVASVTRPDVAAATVPLSLDRATDAWTADATAISFPGTWNVTAIVRTGASSVEVPLVLETSVEGAMVATSASTGQPTLITTTFADGSSLQTYVDPGSAGTNQVHVTAFAAGGGSELSLRDATIVAIPSAGEPRRLAATRLDPGHFVANAGLGSGDWTFDIVADTAKGNALEATWSQTIGAGGG
jgi:copper transport protein